MKVGGKEISTPDELQILLNEVGKTLHEHHPGFEYILLTHDSPKGFMNSIGTINLMTPYIKLAVLNDHMRQIILELLNQSNKIALSILQQEKNQSTVN